MKKLLLISILSVLMICVSGQTIDLTFTAVDDDSYVQLDSIKVMNCTKGCDTVIFGSDTVLTLSVVGIDEPLTNESAFQVFQNYPNPMTVQTTVSLFVPERDNVKMIVTDILGRIILKNERLLGMGKHSFRFKSGNGNLYYFSAEWQGHRSTIKILSALPNSSPTSSIQYIGSESFSTISKATYDIQTFQFSLGDELLYIGYADNLQSGMLKAPDDNGTYTFQFATNIPCPETPTVEYEGQVYNTIQIFSQCWLKENLNVGIMIPGSQSQTNNGTIEKYCYNNELDSCTKYGGLYQWDEMMQYGNLQGAQGICPPGWHLPTDEELKVLEGSVDSQYDIGANTWDSSGVNRGYDAGANLKTTSGWYANGNGFDLYGFSVLPVGRCEEDGSFKEMDKLSIIWASTEDSYYFSRFRAFAYMGHTTARGVWSKLYGFSVRCLRDE
jgi:uncharacterized protein (TIGR02145 family)